MTAIIIDIPHSRILADFQIIPAVKMGKFHPDALLRRIESIRNDPSELDDLEKELRQDCEKGRQIPASFVTREDLIHYFKLDNTEKLSSE